MSLGSKLYKQKKSLKLFASQLTLFPPITQLSRPSKSVVLENRKSIIFIEKREEALADAAVHSALIVFSK